jgi:hypothetical protein
MTNEQKQDRQPAIEDLTPAADVKGGSTNEKKKKVATTGEQKEYLKVELNNVLISG